MGKHQMVSGARASASPSRVDFVIRNFGIKSRRGCEKNGNSDRVFSKAQLDEEAGVRMLGTDLSSGVRGHVKEK